MQAVLRNSSPASQQAWRERPGRHRQGPTVRGCLLRPAGGARLIAEVYMAGGVDEVQRVHLPIACLVPHARLVQLDGDAPLPLQVHAVQKLRLCSTHEQPGSQAVIGTWQEPPRQCRPGSAPRPHWGGAVASSPCHVCGSTPGQGGLVLMVQQSFRDDPAEPQVERSMVMIDPVRGSETALQGTRS